MAENDYNPIRVVFFGDSICVGQGVSLYDGWVTHIARDLSALGTRLGREIVAVNSSINGRTTRQALEDMAYHVQSPGVELMLVQFGMNDCNYWDTDMGLPRVSPEGFRANIGEIIDRGRISGAKRIVLFTNHPTKRTEKLLADGSTTYQESNEQYNNVTREVAANSGDDVILNDMEKVFFDKIMIDKGSLDDYLLPDKLHLSVQGHRLYYEATAPIVSRLLHEMYSNN